MRSTSITVGPPGAGGGRPSALVRNAYLQRRAALIEDSHEVPSDSSDDLYQLVPDDTALDTQRPVE